MEENSNKLFLTIVLTIFLITLAGGVGYLFYQNQQLKNQAYRTTAEDTPSSEVTLTPSTQPTTPPVPYTENTTTPGQKKYVNPELGISFLYLVVDAYDNKTNYTTKEMGNKVYLFPTNSSYEAGQYVEVFDKNPNQTLKQAVETTFLENYSEEKCLASLGELPASYPASYTKAIIKIAGDPSTMSMEEMSEKVAECPKIYTQFGGSAYFLMDNNHADKFVFFSIGQYHILAETEDIAWQDTIEFLD